MRRLRPILSLLVLVSGSLVAPAADLSKIERAIRKEPAYKGKPRYCLLVFGPEAKQKVWMVVDDAHLYVDRDGDGDLTAPAERVVPPPFTPDADTPYVERRDITAGDVLGGKHTALEVQQVRFVPNYVPKSRAEAEEVRQVAAATPGGQVFGISVAVAARLGLGRVRMTAGLDLRGVLRFAGRPAEAPVVHFDGPFRLELVPGQELVHNGKPTSLYCRLGTPGSGAGTFAAVTEPGLVPAEVHPVAELEFPGDRPVRARVALKLRC